MRSLSVHSILSDLEYERLQQHVTLTWLTPWIRWPFLLQFHQISKNEIDPLATHLLMKLHSVPRNKHTHSIDFYSRNGHFIIGDDQMNSSNVILWHCISLRWKYSIWMAIIISKRRQTSMSRAPNHVLVHGKPIQTDRGVWIWMPWHERRQRLFREKKGNENSFSRFAHLT